MSEPRKSIVSPLPGIFYRRPNPQSDVYVREGDTVKSGDTIGLVEVMKNFYEIQAEEDGIIAAFSVENEAMVDVGQEIAVLIPKEDK
ncbi:acetyl-CoA carboxylase biotin carboxyl carrier protein subunit [Kyrpidia spormannii]|uniref:Biotin carboxyl carrier protein of acetyl-CoA carboxylase n=2 Tax=Kyrpidia spormannii TaxID=2055160 RepID=A0A2K8N3R1_9BACL|nr:MULTISPECIES: acetyl-CoA carboxylase [Kyrpidia]HHY66814.1 biotin carboxyl carrier domain-containing protein [Alicyclobacillus sp.]ATY84104.1 acetyl-CoA carboxylase biotin carboxyl carrier protein subunit [Kyrpidia spormannii]MBE3553308.1 biotin carboxyl carrier domain-containing protein [Kyrpidia tusciae]MCL6577032.1 biotin carboxyl carrier domain-containing protein [Kyrpidia sp.]CAB3390271.1 Biotin carboxyl carrier protein of acetyl-CoA carboxylase [Kyrpidia spormannii]